MDTNVIATQRKVCRTCLKHYDSRKNLISLFDHETISPTKISFFDMLKSISNHTVTESDSLPKKVCILCLSQIRTSYYFNAQIEESYEELLKQQKSYDLQLEPYQNVTIKQESMSNMPLIQSPRTIEHDLFNDTEKDADMLIEINPNRMDVDSDNEIIDYEPEMNTFDDIHSDNDDDEEEEELVNHHDSNISVASNTSDKINKSASNSIVEESSLTCSICSKTFNSFKALQCHKRGHSKKCQFCGKNFGSVAQLKLHTKFKHPEKYNDFRVNFQKVSIRIERALNFNECTSCDQMFASKIALLKHHADCDSKCIECGLKIPRRDFYFKHLETVHHLDLKSNSLENISLECPFCFNSFRSERILQEHIQRLHPDENQSNADTLSENGESTSNEGFAFECPICQARFQSSKSLNQHRSFKHKYAPEIYTGKTNNVPKFSRDEFCEKFLVKKCDDFYRCVPCQKDIFRRSLMMHMKSKHSAVRSYRCELCPEAFFRADYRQRHVASNHANDFKCFECDLQFDRSFKYDAHMQRHGIAPKNFKPDEGRDCFDLSPNDIKYIEDSSNYDYTDDYNLLRSDSRATSVSGMSVMTEIPLTKDEFCDKYMINISDLIISCNICQQEIKKSSMVSHLLWKHAIKKPLKCAYCDERVVKNNARIAHMARCHPDEYKCSDCNQQFVRHSSLADHVKYSHNKILMTQPSSGEEEDLNINDMRFISNKNEDEIIEDADNINIEMNIHQDKRFTCLYCAKTFTSSKNLLIHKSHKHKNESREIIPSDTSINEAMSFEDFQNNWVEFVSDTDLKCLVCDKNFTHKSLISHIKAKHCTTGAYLCAVCPEKFFRPEHRFQHMSQNHKGIFYCKPCNTQFYRNSRYATHMNEIHGTVMDTTDSYEVDLNVGDLRFEATVRNGDDDSMPSIVHNHDEVDPMEEMMQQISTSEEMTRTQFIRTFITGGGKERLCLACNKSFLFTSIYHHLIHFHAVTLPFKCPFCSVRFERSYTRNKHLQLFHPKEYKCFECGIQFPKHAKFSDHMAMEHNILASSKSPLEEEDLSSMDVKYIAHKLTENEDSAWQEEENPTPIFNSTRISEYSEEPSTTNAHEEGHFLRPRIKNEPVDIQHTVYTASNSIKEQTSDETVFEEQLYYDDFKQKYLKKLDSESLLCLACNRTIIRTSVCAHLRLWHATTMMFNCELCNVGFRRADYRQRHMSLKHPDHYKCQKCNNMQFYYSNLYKEHMLEAHRMTIKVTQVKKKDEVDVPLEKMKFSKHVPEALRVHPADEISKRGRRLSVCIDPVNPNADGLTFFEFQNTYIEERNGAMRCKVCDEGLTKFSIKKHCKRYHATTPSYYCELCDDVGFQKVDERLSHMEKVHPDAFKCHICNTKFFLSTNYIEHMTLVHNMAINCETKRSKLDVDIPLVRLRFVPRRVKDNSVKKLERPGKSQLLNLPDDSAELTRDQFTYKFLRNFRDKNNDLQTKCLACNKQFSAKHKIFHLYHNHAVDRPFGCEICDMRFFSNFKRVKHLELHHPNDFKCHICNIQFEKGKIYADHMLNEHKISVRIAESKNVDIKHIEIRYTKKSTAVRVLMREQQQHLEENGGDDYEPDNSSSFSESLFCDICNIEFSSSRSYRQHIRDHGGGSDIILKPNEPVEKTVVQPESSTKEYSYECDKCEKKFLALFALNIHKRFKHGEGHETHKRKTEKQKFDVACQICSFTSFRRDYVEHHTKQIHNTEFLCHYCNRALSNFNFYIYHMDKYHNIKEDISSYFKCSECKVQFKLEESLQQHIISKHGDNPPKYHYPCEICSVDFRSRASLESHLDMHAHKNIELFLQTVDFGSLKDEPVQKETIREEEIPSEEINSPPPSKKLKLSPSEAGDDDKLDYLKYLQNTSSGFKCGICGKEKALRKYMLHHLKQHKEVPTYECDKCPERFVFRKKYEKHLEMHENGEIIPHNNEEVLVENDHPKFQDIKKDSTEIKCSICQVSFKFTIMLNKHNNTWHSNDNPLKMQPMNEQKSKKNSSNNTDGEVSRASNETATDGKRLNCDKCKLVFDDQKFLTNHQNFFCINRSQVKRENNDSNVVNEQ